MWIYWSLDFSDNIFLACVCMCMHRFVCVCLCVCEREIIYVCVWRSSPICLLLKSRSSVRSYQPSSDCALWLIQNPHLTNLKSIDVAMNVNFCRIQLLSTFNLLLLVFSPFTDPHVGTGNGLLLFNHSVLCWQNGIMWSCVVNIVWMSSMLSWQVEEVVAQQTI